MLVNRVLHPLAMAPAYAAGSNMPWEQPLQQPVWDDHARVVDERLRLPSRRSNGLTMS